MEEGDEDVGQILGLRAQDLTPAAVLNPGSPSPARRRAGAPILVFIAATLVVAGGLTLMMSRAGGPAHRGQPPSTQAGATPKLDMLTDVPTSASAAGSATGDSVPILDHHPPITRRANRPPLILAQRTRPMRPAARSRRTRSVQIARAQVRQHDAAGRLPQEAEPLDLVSTADTKTSPKEASLMQDRLEATDALRLLRQR